MDFETRPTPSISVLLPAYNHAQYVSLAVESVLSQTWQDFELIAIDDASSDGTFDMLRRFVDPRIRLYRHESNQGSHATLNEALRLAKGQFITIINSDDIFMPDRLTTCHEALVTSGADMVGTDITLIDDAGNPVALHWWLDGYAALKATWQDSRDWPATLLAGNMFMTTSNFFFRRSWLDVIGPFRDYRYVLDYDWLLQGLASQLKLSWLDKPLLQYRLHQSNTINEKPWKANLECACILRKHVAQLLGADSNQRVRLDHLNAQWARIDKYLDELADSRIHEALVAKENELLPLVKDRDRWIVERDRVIELQKLWLEDRDQWIVERDRIIELQKHWLEDRDRWVAERDALIDQQKQWIDDRDRWIAERDHLIASRDAAIDKTRESLDSCRFELERLRSSRSYRIGSALTLPFRWLWNGLSR